MLAPSEAVEEALEEMQSMVSRSQKMQINCQQPQFIEEPHDNKPPYRP